MSANPLFLGFEDISDPRFNTGVLRVLWILGVFDYAFTRRMVGGRWEQWWVEPCWLFVWHPVAQWSTPPQEPGQLYWCPCPPSWGPPRSREDYTGAGDEQP